MARRRTAAANVAPASPPPRVALDVGEKAWRSWMDDRHALLDAMDVPLEERCRLIPYRGPRWS